MFISSCNPKITRNITNAYPALDNMQEVIVFDMEHTAPQEAEILGEVKIGDTGFTTNCSYEVVMNIAKQEARKVGGNGIKITKYTPPFGSTCHRITAQVLRMENIEKFAPIEEEKEILPDVDYAILHVYRMGSKGALVNYDLHLGDSIICRVKNNFRTTLHIKRQGVHTLWARTEKKVELPINFELGKTYYIRCGISIGAFVGWPTIELMDKKMGKAEFNYINAKLQ